MITEPVTISPAGQLVLPKVVRQLLNTRQIAFEISNDEVITIKPLISVKGVLSSYHKQENDFSKIRDQSWNEANHEE